MKGQVWSRPLWHRLAAHPDWPSWVAAADADAVDGTLCEPGTWCIYCWMDISELEVYYVGMTRFSAEHRWPGHVKNAKAGAQTRAYRWLRKALEDERPITPIELLRLPQELAPVAEQALIWSLRESGAPLQNTHAGGGGYESASRDLGESISLGLRQAYAEGRCRRSPEVAREAAARGVATRRANIALGVTPPWPSIQYERTPAHGAAISAGIRRRQAEKGFVTQQEQCDRVGRACDLSGFTVKKLLKTPDDKPMDFPRSTQDRIWAAYKQCLASGELPSLRVSRSVPE